MLFYDRQEAGHILAAELTLYKNQKETLVLGLARGGVVVAFEVAKELSLPLNVVTPRKIGAPENPELALGSIMENGEGIFNSSIIHSFAVSSQYLEREIEKEKLKAQQRFALYRQVVPLPEIKNKTILLVDDGVATGSTMLAVIQAMRQGGVKKVVAAAPVASMEAYQLLLEAADEVFCPYVKEDFLGVARFYERFGQTEDEEVVHLLKRGNQK